MVVVYLQCDWTKESSFHCDGKLQSIQCLCLELQILQDNISCTIGIGKFQVKRLNAIRIL
jgi:hypothetical protein